MLGKSLVSWSPICDVLLSLFHSQKKFWANLFPRIKKKEVFFQPGSGGMTLPPPEGSAGMQGRFGKDQAGSGTETPVPQTLSRHRRALGGRRT